MTMFRLAGGWTVRMRLTLLYSSLLLASGVLLLAVTYTLVRHNIQSGPPTTSKITRNTPGAAELQLCKQALGSPSPKEPAAGSPKLPSELTARCKALFNQAAQAGASAQRSSTLRNLVIYWLVALAVLTLLSALIGWWLAGRALRPISAITAAARRAAEGDLSGRLALDGPDDELRRLGATFDQMLGRLESTFESQRQFIANASHELRTPLAVIRTAIDVTLAKPARGPQEISAMTADIQQAVGRSEALVDALLALARSERASAAREPVDLATLAEDALDEAAGRVKARGLSVDLDLAAAPTAGDPVLLERMIGNLIGNAIAHNRDGGWVRAATGVDQDGAAWVEIENTGEQVPPDAVPQLFEPFKRLHDRTVGDGGLGLGLSIARAVAGSHGAKLTASARAEGGLKVTARFPQR